MKYPLFKVKVNTESAMKNITNVLNSGFINEGEQVHQLELQINKFLGTNQALLVNSCTSAITLALRIIGVGVGDEVISTPMTCIATNTPIYNTGAKIVWADLDISTGQISPSDIGRKITSKTKCIVVVDWAGSPCDLIEIEKIAKSHDIPVIQDAAHAFGAMLDGKSISEYSDFTCYSFQAIKHFTTGDGGALVCRSYKDFNLAKKLKWFGFDREEVKDVKGEWKGQKWDADIKSDEVGYKFNMNNLSAAIGIANLESIQSVLSAHRKNAQTYINLLSSHDKISLLENKPSSLSSHWVFTLRLNLTEKERDVVLKRLNDQGIGAGLVHLPNYVYSAFKEFQLPLPNTENFAATQLSLPCGWWLEEKDCKLIAITLLKELDKVAI